MGIPNNNCLLTLTVDEVKGIHDLLTEDFLNTKDPIEPPGVRMQGELLESAVNRQHAGFGGELKYPDAVSNAATLCYGVCCNHCFHNGNKRTALVSLLCHLDKNNYTLKENIDQNELYSLMIKIAAHRFAPRRKERDTSDIEVREISQWLKRNTRKLKRGERVVTYRELRKILTQYDIYLENPRKNYIDVVKYEWTRKHIFAKKERTAKRVAHIPYPREGMEVGKGVLKNVREACGLTEENGYDSEIFYGAETSIDKFITKYKKTLRRLAKI